MDCRTSTHNGHMFIKLENVLQEKRSGMQKELHNLESNILKEWQVLMSDASNMTTNFIELAKGVDKKLDERANEFHKKVDFILKNEKEQLKELTTTQFEILFQQEEMVAKGLEKIKHRIEECEDQLRNGDIESMLYYEERRKQYILPDISAVAPPIFIPSKFSNKALAEMFGKLTIPQTLHMPASPSQPSHTTEGETSPTTKVATKPTRTKSNAVTESTRTTTHSKRIPATPDEEQKSSNDKTATINHLKQLMSTPVILSEFKAGITLYSLACTGSDRAWVKADDVKLQQLDCRGSVKDTININVSFDDVVLSSQGDILLSDTDTKCIKRVGDAKKPTVLFKTQRTPTGLCCLKSGEIAVTFFDEGQVVIYSMSGKIIKMLEGFFRYPYRLAQSKISSDLYVIDKWNTDIKSSGKVQVLAISPFVKMRNAYTGGPEQRKPFYPCDLCADEIGHVLITDYKNDKVHILDKDGKFIKYLLTKEQGLESPFGICIDSEGNAWIGESKQFISKMRIVKYLQ